MAINWYPGHMAKTRREITECIDMVDAVIEIRDARIVKSSANPIIDQLCEGKPRLILLNKADLCEERVTNMWIKSLSNEFTKVTVGNSLTGKGLNNIKPLLNELLKEKLDAYKKKGLVKYTIRVMVVGIPNVGKSSFINRVGNNTRAKVGDKPGVTKTKQWIKTKLDIDLMDTPGVLWPKFEDESVGLNLAFTGAIKDEIMDIETLALKLIEVLQTYYPERLKERYKLNELSDDPLVNMDNMALKRGAILPGKNIDYTRIAVMVLDEFRGGKLGKISLERP
jgi:ribosome biogenesis GTPase A